MPKAVIELKNEKEEVPLRKNLLNFLRKNSDLSYTLKELHEHFLKLDEKGTKLYSGKEKALYKLVYTYLREFHLQKLVSHKSRYYFYEDKRGLNEKKKN
ncbi:hypothetical protein HYX16_06580 [Candidatus Woesearchaeota archaeon]|nr:hypothetical protein [Candidatus Woesearchaeota archaeon]